MRCPYNGFRDCMGDSCAVYNPFLNGCSVMTTPLALGEEFRGIRVALEKISSQLESLERSCSTGMNAVCQEIAAATDEMSCLADEREVPAVRVLEPVEVQV
ncbi:hypothetical protein [Methanolobus chelungpuianus]|uniref:Uncharacterized protein n=1 Tax=Methanolobus chelungpuianus TaxID=502115 RepID=A0AAE3KX81_9EURY|nr:hypothetical protein [Methanolobus chelungpuianus]MCQ6962781.1 hypothetical protein [Methanolobus chelungpuianus]